jgi:hypothetical protein
MGLVFTSLSWGCAGNQLSQVYLYDEVIGETVIPIPGSMERVEEGRVELALPGFGGGKAVFRGWVRPEEVVEFYRSEMLARGWTQNASILARGGALAYYRAGRSVVITVAPGEGGTILDIVVGKLGS